LIVTTRIVPHGNGVGALRGITRIVSHGDSSDTLIGRTRTTSHSRGVGALRGLTSTWTNGDVILRRIMGFHEDFTTHHDVTREVDGP
jgi:hypothetical protein